MAYVFRGMRKRCGNADVTAAVNGDVPPSAKKASAQISILKRNKCLRFNLPFPPISHSHFALQITQSFSLLHLALVPNIFLKINR